MRKKPRACAYCGTEIPHPPHARRGEDLVCEGCFLSQSTPAEVRAAPEAPCLPLPIALAAAMDEREMETGLHSRRVARYAVALARGGSDDPVFLRQLYWGALLHDIGKIGVRDAVLLKPGPLGEPEWTEMRSHPQKGHAILSGVSFLAGAAEIVLCHEERFDGTGYPRGLAGGDIPWGARLFAIIDTLDAMTSDRPYRKASPFDEAKAEIVRRSGTQFDPEAVDLFLAQEGKLRELAELKTGELTIPLP